MKILHYVDENKLAWGETWIQLIKELSLHGIDNFVVCRPGGTLAGRLEEEGLSFAAAKPFIQALPFTCMSFGRIINEFRPDVIHTRLSSAARIGGWWGKRMNVPVVETIDKYPKIKYYRDASMIFPCSNAVKAHMLKEGFPEDKMQVVYNPIDIGRYKRNFSVRNELRASYGIGNDTKVILGAGRFIDWKGFEFLIEAYARFISAGRHTCDTKLWLVGDGPEMQKYKGLASRLGLSGMVEFPGFAQDIRPWLWAADIFVQPSQLPEGFSLMLLEAMAAGLPPIATNIGGTPDIIQPGENGWVIKTGSDNGLAELLSDVSCNESLLANMAEAAVKSAARFNVESIASETIDIYSRVIEEYKR